MQTMTVDGFIAELTIDEDVGVIHGEVINARAVLTFSSTDVGGLEDAFKGTLKDYREWCAERGLSPEKPYSGTLSLRLPPSLHRYVAQEASKRELSVNSYIVKTLEKATLAESEAHSG